MWQQIVRKKYLVNQSIASVKHRFDDSPCWSDLLKVKELYMASRSIQVGSGNTARFWEDAWISSTPTLTLYILSYMTSVRFMMSLYNSVSIAIGFSLLGDG